MNTELWTGKAAVDGPGEDLSLGLVNVNTEPGPNQGIHVGVISQHECLQAWADSSKEDLGKPEEIECPLCGEPFQAAGGTEWGDIVECPGPNCNHHFEAGQDMELEAIGYDLNDGEYLAYAGNDGDIMITSSPYYTYSHFCNLCAPGAGYLMSPFRIPKRYKETAHALTEISPDTESDLYQTLAQAAKFPKCFCFSHDFFEDIKQGEKPCDYCEGTGKRKVSDIGIAIFNVEQFTANGGKIIDEDHVECWVCHGKGIVDNMVSQAPYRVFSIATGLEVKP